MGIRASLSAVAANSARAFIKFSKDNFTSSLTVSGVGVILGMITKSEKRVRNGDKKRPGDFWVGPVKRPTPPECNYELVKFCCVSAKSARCSVIFP